MILKGQFFIFHNIAASQLGCNINDFNRFNFEFFQNSTCDLYIYTAKMPILKS